jgi:hypothetical protein
MQPETQQTPQAGWQFHTEDAAPDQPTPQSDAATMGPIEWSASEYVSHSKSPVWYMQLALIAVAVTGLAFFITRDFVVAATIVVVAIIFGVAAGRKPRVLHYAIDNRGITISQKKYPYTMFKSFSVIQEGPIRSIFLMPIKRFNPPLSLYYPPEGEAAIIETIGSHLPQEAREQDRIDRLMHKIRF